jgi:hypothetical protein
MRANDGIGHAGGAGWRWAPLALAAMFAAAVLPVALLGADATSEAWDESTSHLPVIRQFAAEWPRPDLVGYPSATAPGYHLLMAMPARVGLGVQGLRVLSGLFGLALVLVAWRGAARWTGPWLGAALALPIALGTYVVSGSAWLTTDVLSVLLGTALVAVMAWQPPGGRAFLSAGTLFAAAVAVRQTNVFLAAPVLAAGLLGSPAGRAASPAEQWAGDEPRGWSRAWGAALALVPGVLILAALVQAWGGLTPPAYRAMHDAGLSPVAPVYGLALVGCWGTVLMAAMPMEAMRAFRRHAWAVLALVALAAFASALPESAWSKDAGRWGGPLWTAVRALPSWESRSPFVIACAMAGTMVLSVLWIRAAEVGRGRMATVTVVALLALFVVQAGNSQVWERYFDPAVLVALAWLAAMGIDRTRPHSAGRLALGALVLAAVQAAISAVTVWLPAFRGNAP